MAEREFTGRHAAAIFIGAFGVIIAVNVALAVSAVRSFPGLEVKNSYVASQEFNQRRADQLELGWTVAARAEADRVILSITDRKGHPVQLDKLQATLGRATHVKDDIEPEFAFDGAVYRAHARLAPGNWNIRLVALAKNGTEFRQRIVLHVSG